MTNPLRQLKAQGQSVWFDNIDRAQLLSGLFQRLIDEDGIWAPPPIPPSLNSRSV